MSVDHFIVYMHDEITRLCHSAKPTSVAQLIVPRYALPGYTVIGGSGFEAQAG